MTENKRFTFTQDTLAKADVFDNEEFVCCTLSVWVEQLVDLLNELNRLAEGNEETLLKVMTYLHNEYYDIWEEVNKECFND